MAAPGLASTGASFVSGEGVALDLRTATIATRALAGAIDFAAQLGGFFILALLDVALTAGADIDARRAVLIVEAVLVLAGYPLLFEWLGRGRTLGKMALGLRVVRDDGGPISFRQALVRALTGLVLEKPGLFVPISTFAAMATIVANPAEKRIGDLMAGTVVLNERLAPPGRALAPPWVAPQMRPWVLGADLSRLDDRLALALRHFVSRAFEMTPEAQQRIGEQLRARVVAVVTPEPPAWLPTPTLLQGVLAERRRRGGEPVASDPWNRPAGDGTHYRAGFSWATAAARQPTDSAPSATTEPARAAPPDQWSDERPPDGPSGRPTFTPPA